MKMTIVPTTELTPCLRCPLRRTGAFAGITAEQLAFIQGFKTREVVGATGDLLMREGETTGELYTLLSGWAFRFRMLRDGSRQILNFLLPGDFIGLQEQLGVGSPHGVELLTPARICCFPADQLWELSRVHPDLSYDVTWLAAHEELIVDENLVSVGQRSAQQRVAMLLVHIFKRAESIGLKRADGSVPFPINQQHMADALGLSLVHTNKTLRKLVGAGLHAIREDRLQLLKPDSLNRLADYFALPMRLRPLI